MKDYARIKTKIAESVWLITDSGLQTILSIVEDRFNNGRLNDAEIAERIRLNDAGKQGYDDTAGERYTVNNGVGIIPLMGPIFGKANLMTQLSGATSLETFLSDFKVLMADDGVHSIVIQADTPGGTSDMVSEVASEILAARETKPVYTIADPLLGSAGYWIGSQSTALYSTSSGSVGSIGAYTVHEDRSVRDAQEGVKYTYISAGKYKTEGNPHEALSKEGVAYRQELIDEVYNEFVDAVAVGRGTDSETIIQDYGGGRMVSVKKAIENGMVDGVTNLPELVNNLQSQHTFFPINPIPSTGVASITSSGMIRIQGDNKTYMLIPTTTTTNLEHRDMEHSEPGTGNPPAPRRDGDGSDDPAIVGRWRRDHELPMDSADPRAPKPNSNPANSNVSANDEGRVVNLRPETFAELCQLYGIDSESENADSELIGMATAANLELALFKNKGGLEPTEQERSFAKDYPEQHARLVELVESDREVKATAFAASVAAFKAPQGDELVPTKMGLSALAVDTLTEIHKKFSAGAATIEDFETAVTAITNGGVVDFGEVGSSISNDDSTAIDVTSPQGVQQMRQLFADKVSEIQVKSEQPMTYSEAIVEATRKYPDLAQAYKNSALVSR
jgi:signal peptide peptidase SppA